jgi:EAL domain-containing protein (putative c-di-GMP-specific phosphodiesterase class I)
MDRKDIMFEVSESEAINNFELMMRVRDSLEKMEMRIATDDFGKGYSGLEQIIKIRPDLIKLDRSLIQDIHTDNPKQAFVTGLVRAAKIAGTTVLAEGVEKWEEAEVLKDMGIKLIQGFLLHRPQAADEILHDLQTQISLESVA